MKMSNFYTVLVVDDEVLIRQGIIHYVDWESNGYQIIGEAANGKEAIEKIEQQAPHIILTDIVMPSMDGIELIQFVKKHYPTIEIIVLSSYEEFDYVRKTFQLGVADYILKPKLNEQEILKTLDSLVVKRTTIRQEQVNISTEEAIRKLIQGYQTVREFNYLQETLQNQTMLLIEVFTKPNEEIHITKKKLLAHCERMKIPLSIIELALENHNKLFLLYTTEADIWKHAHLVLEKLSLPSSIKITISEPFYDVERIKDMYHLLEKTRRFHFYLPGKPTLFTNQLPKIKTPTISFDFNHFIHLFKQCQLEQALSYIELNIKDISDTYGMEIHEFQSWLANVCFNMIVHIDYMNLDSNKLEEKKYDYLKQINDAFDIEEAMAVYHHLVREVKALLVKKENSTPMIEQLLLYIEENYREPLSLEELAKHFHFNPSYLSTFFSKHMKQGFNEYLQKIRIEQAKKLLIDSNISISSISERVGYSDPSYFTKVFRKMEGVSPRQYRRKVVESQ